MNLLTEAWIPVRPLPAGAPEKITLRRLLCEDEKWELCLPRDDMELAALQMLVCMAQVFFIPKDMGELKQRITVPLLPEEFDAGCAPYKEWFGLDHPDFPFMQRKGAKVETPMDKLLAGVTGAQNCCFVNEPGLAARLCGGCISIALFNLSSCSPSFGGGFKLGLRQGAAVTTFIAGDDLRQTVWLNVLAAEKLESCLPWHSATNNQKPTWVEPIKPGKIHAAQIGLFRGLFWQPAHVILGSADGPGQCSCCGFESDTNYSHFFKDKFSNYEVEGTWPHPHSPTISSIGRDGTLTEHIVSFGKSNAPAWTNLSRFVVQQQAEDRNPGQRPAAVILQAMDFLNKERIRMIVGGYQNQKGQATILGRRHEVYTFNPGWGSNTHVVAEIVQQAMGYKSALNSAMWVFASEIISNKTSRQKWLGCIEEQFYRRTEDAVLDTLANTDFANPVPTLLAMGERLHKTVTELFEIAVQPYLNDPELVKTMAISRNKLDGDLKALKPQQDGRKDDGTNG
ncbi:MAG: hypothetical protein ACD_75C01275G0002 [uncultured bacterium]|nr:MAG: hypothetical protein ACD_75C01275G0002 [uncultured bacterium]